MTKEIGPIRNFGDRIPSCVTFALKYRTIDMAPEEATQTVPPTLGNRSPKVVAAVTKPGCYVLEVDASTVRSCDG